MRFDAAQNRQGDEGVVSSAEAETVNDATEQRSSLEMVMQPQEEEEDDNDDSPTLLPQYSSESTTTATKSVHEMTACDRFQTVFSLWSYTVPLFFVYMTEYIMMVSHSNVVFSGPCNVSSLFLTRRTFMQAGVWLAIGRFSRQIGQIRHQIRSCGDTLGSAAEAEPTLEI